MARDWKMKDWALGALSNLDERAKLDQKRAILDPANPSEAGQKSNPRPHGMVGRDRHTKCWGWIVCHNGAETQNAAARSFFLGIPGALSAIILLHHGLTPPLTLTSPFRSFWCGEVRRLSDGVEDEGLGPWGLK